MNSLFIDGKWIAARGAHFDKYDPATGATIWQGQCANLQDIELALAAARRAFQVTLTTSLDERLRWVRCFAAGLVAAKSDLTEIIAQETGKPLWEASLEVTSMVSKVELAINAYQARTGEYIDSSEGTATVLRHRPHGVVAVFGPYNFPGHLPNGHIVPAIIAGNTVIFKPSELAPWTAQLTVKIWQEAGLPDGALNLIQGGKETGAALIKSDGLDGLFFTGSSTTGRAFHRYFAGQPEKILALEMGGNNPLIVEEVDDEAAAVLLCIQSAFISAGQRCTCARRLLVPTGSWGDHFIERLLSVTSQLRIGRYHEDPAPFMGPVISRQAVEHLLAAQQQLEALGARILLPMQRRDERTAFISPGIVDVTPIEAQPDCEWFGPFLQLVRYQSFDAAIEAANATHYGLAAGLISDERARYLYFLQRSRAGVVNWNRPLTGASSALPFGGIGRSGNHRPGAWYAADYCAYPVASLESETLTLPKDLPPGVRV